MRNIDEIIKEMSLEDKISLCTGLDFWRTKSFEKYGIPSMFMCDGPLGLRKQSNKSDMLGVNNSDPATCFPAEVTTANSWDVKLLERIGKAFGEEARNQKVGLILGPGANIKRNPLCGRNFEYYSEDPYLAGKMAAGFIRGLESEGVGTSLKHFAVNSQELARFTSDGVIDERTLREIYLTAFEIAVKEGNPSTVMCSYPKLNGVHASDSKKLLTDILRTEWGFDGMVVTDWGALNNRTEAFKAGCDLNMPGGSTYGEKDAVRAVKDGSLDESLVDESVRRILKLVSRATETLKDDYDCDYESHHNLSKEAAVSGAVLLKNEDSILPISKESKIAVVGYMAKDMRYQGAGSSHINPVKLSQPLDYMGDVLYSEGCDVNGNTNEELLNQAKEAVKNADVCVVFAGLPARYESEGFDRDTYTMPDGHIKMIEAVAETNSNTVVVLMSGSAVECPWADKAKGILYMGLPGQAGGEAVADLIYGKVNPSGKLTESWPFSYSDVPSSETYCKQNDALYQEGIYVGYRYYDKAKLPVRWSFGYGLSYTEFEYSDLTVDGNSVKVTVKNIGECDGAETVIMFVGAPQDGIHRPLKELKGFKKIFLRKGEEKQIEFTLDNRSFAVWADGWKVPSGRYTIEIGGLTAETDIQGEAVAVPEWQSGSFYENCQGRPVQAEWEKMLGRKYVAPVLKKGEFTMDNTVTEMKDYSLIMKIMYKSVEMVISKGFGGKADYDNPEFRMLMASSASSSLRSMQISGGMPDGIMQGMLEMANGHFFKGIGKMLGR